MSVIVRSVGLFLLVVGLIVGLLTIREALLLYKNPDRVERFAVAIEQGSNIDKSLTSFRESALGDTGDKDAAPSADTGSTQKSTHDPGNIRVSYFVSWVIVLLLLLLIARIALAAIKTGGELVLYDMNVKQLARMLIKESGGSNRR